MIPPEKRARRGVYILPISGKRGGRRSRVFQSESPPVIRRRETLAFSFIVYANPGDADPHSEGAASQSAALHEYRGGQRLLMRAQAGRKAPRERRVPQVPAPISGRYPKITSPKIPIVDVSGCRDSRSFLQRLGIGLQSVRINLPSFKIGLRSDCTSLQRYQISLLSLGVGLSLVPTVLRRNVLPDSSRRL